MANISVCNSIRVFQIAKSLKVHVFQMESHYYCPKYYSKMRVFGAMHRNGISSENHELLDFWQFGTPYNSYISSSSCSQNFDHCVVHMVSPRSSSDSTRLYLDIFQMCIGHFLLCTLHKPMIGTSWNDANFITADPGRGLLKHKLHTNFQSSTIYSQ